MTRRNVLKATGLAAAAALLLEARAAKGEATPATRGVCVCHGCQASPVALPLGRDALGVRRVVGEAGRHLAPAYVLLWG